ncbi:hypothetical protein SAMN05192574_101397 [Mucilaginibacter gossypiicola]|uniref:Uncharacterized protein n=1 Tax=Mucilaginibacter gossypiicola TaxID=551995 RepID=A0A1H8A778_9SPHI|nr:hypothetical protein [Mucilaginibacter gossypiicola]SEM66645.1 hypothetical protein SAMN05192574_101397 [Mucilaginibacter gossypiicola]
MTAITLKQLPDDVHRAIKRIQLDKEDEGQKLKLEEIYVLVLKEGLESLEKKKPAK